MNTKTIDKIKPTKTDRKSKTPETNSVKYTPLEMEAIRLGKEIKKSLEGTKNEFV